MAVVALLALLLSRTRQSWKTLPLSSPCARQRLRCVVVPLPKLALLGGSIYIMEGERAEGSVYEEAGRSRGEKGWSVGAEEGRSRGEGKDAVSARRKDEEGMDADSVSKEEGREGKDAVSARKKESRVTI